MWLTTLQTLINVAVIFLFRHVCKGMSFALCSLEQQRGSASTRHFGSPKGLPPEAAQTLTPYGSDCPRLYRLLPRRNTALAAA